MLTELELLIRAKMPETTQKSFYLGRLLITCVKWKNLSNSKVKKKYNEIYGPCPSTEEWIKMCYIYIQWNITQP